MKIHIQFKMGPVMPKHFEELCLERTRDKFQAMIDSDDGEIPKKFKTKKFAQRLLPSTWGKNGPTITACSLPDDFVHYKQARSLTVREWARLQTFPDWYQFAGKRTTGGTRRSGTPDSTAADIEIPNVELTLNKMYDGVSATTSFTDTTNEAGHFLFESLAEGNYSLSFSKEEENDCPEIQYGVSAVDIRV